MSIDSSEKRNKFTQMGFQSSYSIPEFIDPHSTPKSVSTPIRPLSLYRPLRESHRPQGVDIDHFGYPCIKHIALNIRKLTIEEKPKFDK
ncbi:hypothetical protein T07_10492 [Trichinella nelsoni]|uniref:Uncharacterized protein n=1 Tax=Trichinella nelsoni TaxID=6336 RepID=A0A0V0SIK5_9BILA|nr:hypothetical protein T07_10492 [Trichinella nelsoni]